MNEPRHRRGSSLPLLALVSTLSLAACGPGPTTGGGPARQPATASGVAASAASVASLGGSPVAITLTIGGRAYPASLSDNPASRDLVAQLPLSLTFRDYNRVEKIASLPRPLTTVGVPAGADPEVNDIGYYAPTGDLVLYYGDVGYWNGIVRLGVLPGGMPEIARQPDGFLATIRRA